MLPAERRTPEHAIGASFYSPEELVQSGNFSTALVHTIQTLLDLHQRLPREVRHFADIQRWMVSQATIALHFERKLDPMKPPVTPGNVVGFFDGLPIASRNTILSFLMEMRHRRYVEEVASHDRRQRVFEVSEMAEQLIRVWFHAHLEALDLIDGGSRIDLSNADLSLICYAHPRMMRLLRNRDDWFRPAPGVANFVKSDSGSSILHDLVMAAPDDWREHARVSLGTVSPSLMAKRYSISSSHTSRLFSKAREQGYFGWSEQGYRGDCWLSTDLIRAYRYWQAIKFSVISQAFHDALNMKTKVQDNRYHGSFES
ncbi:hypothetical protein [Oryzifoliimicrobium ureilyticus]|uniref:hypothetical protein n=1 Tax=Oryzifoliimicrobium ureilyticus TaxID=3113724 RepID=UPI003075F390